MNYRQVQAVERLMRWATPPTRSEDEPRPELLMDLAVLDGKDDGASGAPFGGSTYVVKLWTVEGGYRFPDLFYVRSDGLVYTYDSETDSSHEVKGVRWTGWWPYQLDVDVAAEALA